MSKPPASKKTRVAHQTVDLYQFVIDDTVSKVKGEFVQEGIAEDVLDELRALWENALSKTGVCAVDEPQAEAEPEAQPAPAAAASQPLAYKQEPGPSASQGLMPPSLTQQYQARAPGPSQPQPSYAPQVLQSQPPPQANYMMQYLPPHQQQMNPLAMPPQQQQQQQYMNMQPGAWPMPGGAHYTQQQIQAYQQRIFQQAATQAQAQQAQYMTQMQPASYPMQAPPVTTAPPPALASLAGHKRSLDEIGVASTADAAPAAKQLNTGNGLNAPTIPQQDGPADDGAAPATTSAPASTAAEEEEDGIGPGDSGDELNEGDDLADVDDHEEIDEELIKDVVLGQFEKVHRSKAKWKVNLKNCVATINEVDYLLKKVTGEMNF